MPKERPRQHELETESELALRSLRPIGWVIRDLTKSDYGVDCEVEIFTEQVSTGLTVSASTGVRSSQYSKGRRWLYQSTHSAVAISRSSKPRHGRRVLTSSVLYKPITDSASALSCEDPTAPVDGLTPATSSRSVWASERYWRHCCVKRSADHDAGRFPVDLHI